VKTKSLAKVIKDCREGIAAVEWWNKHRTDAEPMDCEPERLMLRLAERLWAETNLQRCVELAAELRRVAELSVDERDAKGILKSAAPGEVAGG
jgi:hypothetical protein